MGQHSKYSFEMKLDAQNIWKEAVQQKVSPEAWEQMEHVSSSG